jgi:transposase InsO family protein
VPNVKRRRRSKWGGSHLIFFPELNHSELEFSAEISLAGKERMDFLNDQLFDGRKIRILEVIDLYSRFSPALDPRFSYRAADVVGTLDRAAAMTGYPRTISVGIGPEFVSRDLDLWAFSHWI